MQVGTVTKVALDGYRAKVTMSIVDGRRIPVGTTAVLGQSSLLGENYVQLRFPPQFDPVRGPFLRDGAAVVNTRVDPSLEHVAEQGIEVLAAVQGGDLAAIVNTGATGLGGRGSQMRELIRQLADVGQAFGSQSGDLATIVDGLGALGTQLADGSGDIGALLDSLSGATKTITAQRDGIVDAVRGLTVLARALDEHVLDPHGRQLTTLIAQLDPIAAALGANTDTIGKLLSGLRITAERGPRAISEGNSVLLYGWLDSFRANDGTTTPFPGGAAAIRSLLDPPRARRDSADRRQRRVLRPHGRRPGGVGGDQRRLVRLHRPAVHRHRPVPDLTRPELALRGDIPGPADRRHQQGRARRQGRHRHDEDRPRPEGAPRRRRRRPSQVCGRGAYVDLQPIPDTDPDAGPRLAGGDRIPLERTSTPLAYSELFKAVDQLVAAIEPDDLRTLVHELAVGLDGRGDSLRQLFAGADQITEDLATNAELLDSTISDLTELTHTFAAHRGALASSFDNLAALAQTLRRSEQDVVALLEKGPTLGNSLADLAAASKHDLGCTLDALGVVGARLDRAR